MAATLADKELSLLIDGQPLLAVYPSDDAEECAFIASQWKHVCRSTNVTEAYGAKKLVASLLALRATAHQPLRSQVVALDVQISGLEKEIAIKEETLNDLVYRAYELTDEERDLIQESEHA